MRHWLLLFLALGLMTVAWAGRVVNDSGITNPFNHHLWNLILNEHVDAEGYVAWDRLRANPKRLNNYLDQLASASPENRPDLFPSQADKTAYWINAYNALSVRLILDRYPAERLAEVPNFTTNARYRVGQTPMSLKQMRERVGSLTVLNPKVLWALSDLTVSGPPLLPEAYVAAKLPAQLTRQEARAKANLLQVIDTPPCATLLVHPSLADMIQPLRERQAILTKTPKDSVDAVSVLLPYASPEAQGLLRQPCEHPTDILPTDDRLRNSALVN